MIESCLGKAARRYKVRIVAYIFMANHLHIVVIVQSPEEASKFVGYLKQEMSHAVNRMLGRRQKTVWKAEFDSPILLSGDRCLEEMTYTVVNPCAADLADLPEEYIGVSSIRSLKSDTPVTFNVPAFRRSFFTKLDRPSQPYREDHTYHAALVKSSEENVEITIDPWAIRDVYPELAAVSIDELRQKLWFKINGQVEKARQKRIKEQRQVVGATRLYQMSMLLTYVPTKFGRKSVCLGSTRAEVIDYLTFFKQLVIEAKAVFERWKKNDFSILYPIGMYPPHLPKTGNYLASILT